MKIAAISDLHLTNSKDDSGETLGEQVERLCLIADDAAKRGPVDLVVCAGDTFHARSNAAERNAAVVVYQQFAQVAPVLIVRGNNSHDGVGEISFLSQIRSQHQIYVDEIPRMHQFNGALVFGLPFPEKQNLAALAAAISEAPGSVTEQAQSALKALFLSWATKAAKHDGPTVMVAHLELGGAQLDSGQPAVGKCFVEMTETDLAEIGLDVCILGHIHQHQSFRDGRIFYVGSPRQTTFGEDWQKGYCLVDIDHGNSLVVEHIRAPGPQLVTIEGGWVSDLGRLTTENDDNDETWWIPEDASDYIMRLTYSVFESNRAAAAEQAEQLKQLWLDAGARSVKIDARTIATTRTRSEEIQTARTNTDRLGAYWGSRGQKPDRHESIVSKLDELEDAAQTKGLVTMEAVTHTPACNSQTGRVDLNFQAT